MSSPDYPQPEARALAFDGCAARLHPAKGDVGVVLCSAWGFEEFSLRRAWRMLAQSLAEAGFPTLRFDYPGCGDSLGEAADGLSLAACVEAAVGAAETLRRESGVGRIVVVGQGFGAWVAALAARRIGTAGLALLAPAARGRDFLRELAVWGQTAAEALLLPAAAVDPRTVAGFPMPQSLAAELAALNLADLAEAPAPAALVVARPGRAGEARSAAALRALGVEVSEAEYEGYEAAVSNPTAAQPPVRALAAVRDWLCDRFPPAELAAAAAVSAGGILLGDDFIETPTSIAGGRSLAGVLCEPRGRRRGATVLLLSSGADPHMGWARSHVVFARALAREGVASLRLDLSDVADSPGPLSGEAVRLYRDEHVADVVRAAGWLAERGLGPVLPVGRCSGAFYAFNGALADARIGEAILVNQRRYVWNRNPELEGATDNVGYYRRQARDPVRLLWRWIKGDIDLEAALARLGRSAVATLAGLLRGEGRRLRAEVLGAFRQLRGREVRLNLVFSRDGDAHADFRAMFGAEGQRLARFANVRLSFIDGADHCLTPAPARAALLALIRERSLAAGRRAPVAAVVRQAAPERGTRRAVALSAKNIVARDNAFPGTASS